MHKLCVMVNEIYCHLCCCAVQAQEQFLSPSNRFQAKREMFKLAVVVSPVLLCLLLFSVLDEICTFSQICSQLFDLPQCSFL